MISGKRPESYFPNIAEMYKTLKEDERIIFDIESGYPYKVTKEYYDWYMKLYEAALPKAFRDSRAVYFTGTGNTEGFSKCSDAREMFYNPEKYNIKYYGEFNTDSETR